MQQVYPVELSDQLANRVVEVQLSAECHAQNRGRHQHGVGNHEVNTHPEHDAFQRRIAEESTSQRVAIDGREKSVLSRHVLHPCSGTAFRPHASRTPVSAQQPA